MPRWPRGEVSSHPERRVPHAVTRGLQGTEQHVHRLLLCEGTAILATAAGTQGGQGVGSQNLRKTLTHSAQLSKLFTPTESGRGQGPREGFE